MNIESILKYQSVDAKIHEIEQKLSNSGFRKKANELSAVAKKAQTRSAELEAEAEKVLADIEDLKNKYNINKSKSDEICAKNVDDMSADEIEKIAALKNKIANNLNILEKLLQKSAESINNILSNFNKTKKTFDDAKAQYAVCKQKIDEETAALEPEKKKLEAELSKMEAGVDGQLLAEYKKRRNDRIFPVVCALEGENFCGGCRMELPMQIDNYISRIKAYKQYTKSTIDLNRRVLQSLNTFIKKHTNNKRSLEDTEKLESQDYENWMIEEIKKGRSSRTCNIKLICLRNFLKYAEIHHENVMNYREVALMKETKKKIEALTEQEEQKLLSYILTDTSKEPILRLRDIGIALILANTGLRVHELCNIKVKDVAPELRVIGKNHQPRIVYLFDNILDTLKSYLQLRKEKGIESEYLFCAHRGPNTRNKLSRNSIEYMIRQAGIKAGLKTPVWPHKLRHTFATKLLRRGGNIFYIKELLGHSNLSTTQTYLTATNEDLRRTQDLLKDPIETKNTDN